MLVGYLLCVLGAAAEPLVPITRVPGSMPVALDDSEENFLQLMLNKSPQLMQVFRSKVADPASWDLVANLSPDKQAGRVLNVALEGNVAAAAFESEGLNVYDLAGASPGEPVFAETIKACWGLTVHDGTIFCGSGYDREIVMMNTVYAYQRVDGQWTNAFNITAPKFAGKLVNFGWQIVVGKKVMLISDQWAHVTDGDEGAVFVYSITQQEPFSWEYRTSFQGVKGGQEFGCGLALAPDEKSFFVGSHFSGGLQLFSQDEEGNWGRVAVYEIPSGFLGHSVQFLASNLAVMLGTDALFVWSSDPQGQWGPAYDPFPMSFNPWRTGYLSVALLSSSNTTAVFAVFDDKQENVGLFQPRYLPPQGKGRPDKGALQE